MRLQSLSYSENEGTPEEWSVKDLDFGQMTLIVGINASGKTRMVNLLKVLAYMIKGALMPLNGNRKMTFQKKTDEVFSYECCVKDRKLAQEKILINNILILDRKQNFGRIKNMSYQKPQLKKFSPPSDKFTLQVRRDIKEYPFL